MTMQREAKSELQIKVYRIRKGYEHIMSYSPRQFAKYGRWLPTDIAIKLEVSMDRRATSKSRGTWIIETIQNRRRVRSVAKVF